MKAGPPHRCTPHLGGWMPLEQCKIVTLPPSSLDSLPCGGRRIWQVVAALLGLLPRQCRGSSGPRGRDALNSLECRSFGGESGSLQCNGVGLGGDRVPDIVSPDNQPIENPRHGPLASGTFSWGNRAVALNTQVRCILLSSIRAKGC